MKTALVTLRLRLPLSADEYLVEGNQFFTDEELSEDIGENFDFPILGRELKSGNWKLEGLEVEVEGEWEEESKS